MNNKFRLSLALLLGAATCSPRFDSRPEVIPPLERLCQAKTFMGLGSGVTKRIIELASAPVIPLTTEAGQVIVSGVPLSQIIASLRNKGEFFYLFLPILNNEAAYLSKPGTCLAFGKYTLKIRDFVALPPPERRDHPYWYQHDRYDFWGKEDQDSDKQLYLAPAKSLLDLPLEELAFEPYDRILEHLAGLNIDAHEDAYKIHPMILGVLREYSFELNAAEPQLITAWITLEYLMEMASQNLKLLNQDWMSIEWSDRTHRPIEHALDWPTETPDRPLYELLRRVSFMAAKQYNFYRDHDHLCNNEICLFQPSYGIQYSKEYDPMQTLDIGTRTENANRWNFPMYIFVHALCAYVLKIFGTRIDEMSIAMMEKHLNTWPKRRIINQKLPKPTPSEQSASSSSSSSTQRPV